MPRKVRIEQGVSWSTKANDLAESYYELTITRFNITNNNIACTITSTNPSNSRQPENFSGKFRLKKNGTVLVAILKEDELGLAVMQLKVVASDSHALRDRIIISPGNLEDLMDSVERVPDQNHNLVALRTNVQPLVLTGSGQQLDPDAETFQRQGATVTAPIAAGTTTGTTGRIQQGTVIIRDAASALYAYDIPTNANNGQLYTYTEAGMPPTPTQVGTVVYGPNFSVTITTPGAFVGTVESLRP